jgi:L-ascorbate metabolism protein UlaG (beta-lactamase superfamily)
MMITKYHHACLLVQHDGKVVLIDPGNYTADSGQFDPQSLTQLDGVVYTHEHQDHLYVPFLQKILQKFPNVPIVANDSIKGILAKENISTASSLPDWVTQEDAAHEPLVPGMAMCPNISYTVFGKLTHPGDSLHFTKTAEVLALPVTAPWGSMTQAITKALEVKPKVIVPIHDWHWKDEARRGMYGMMKGLFEKSGIDFRVIESSEPITLT